jgi:hypothetical protein
VFESAVGERRTMLWMMALDKKNRILNPESSIEMPDGIKLIYEFSDCKAI